MPTAAHTTNHTHIRMHRHTHTPHIQDRSAICRLLIHYCYYRNGTAIPCHSPCIFHWAYSIAYTHPASRLDAATVHVWHKLQENIIAKVYAVDSVDHCAPLETGTSQAVFEKWFFAFDYSIVIPEATAICTFLFRPSRNVLRFSNMRRIAIICHIHCCCYCYWGHVTHTHTLTHP